MLTLQETHESFTFHMHGGYYGDGNSHYWSTDSTVYFADRTYVTDREDSYGGQLAGSSQYAHKEDRQQTSREAKWLTPEQQQQVMDHLAPLLETARKYRHYSYWNKGKYLRFFTDKHKYYFHGRVKKAREIAQESDLYGVSNLSEAFLLPDLGIMIKIYLGKEYKERYSWKIELFDSADLS